MLDERLGRGLKFVSGDTLRRHPDESHAGATGALAIAAQ
jgi:hypothetical protein